MAASSRPSQAVKPLADTTLVSVPPTLTSPGQPGWWARDEDTFYVYTSNRGEAHQWIAIGQGGGGDGSGDVVGPASSVNLRVAVFSGTTGKEIADGGVLLSALAPLASPALTGNPTAPTQDSADNTTKVSTTAFVHLVAAGRLAKGSNLSDLTDAAAARTNLGLGSLATQSGTFSGTSSGTNTGDQTSVTGNAGTATALQTARTINGVSFNGTANITVPASSDAQSVAQAGHGFIVGDLVRPTTGGAWTKAQADSLANCLGTRYVTAVADANTFSHASIGPIAVTALTALTEYYLDPITAGAFTATAPTTVGHVYLPLFNTLTTTTAELKIGEPILIEAETNPIEHETIPLGDQVTAAVAGTAKNTWRAPYALTLISVRAYCVTAPTGSTAIIDINESGSTILSTKLSIDAGEKTSTTAATPPVISNTAIADDAELTFDLDQVGSTIAGAGYAVTLIFRRA